MSDKIVHWLPSTDLRNNHRGLAQLAQDKLGVKIENLRHNEFVLFVNSSWTQYKMYRGGSLNTVLHYKCNEGDRLNAKAIIASPRYQLNGDIGYKKALTRVIEADYTRWENR